MFVSVMDVNAISVGFFSLLCYFNIQVELFFFFLVYLLVIQFSLSVNCSFLLISNNNFFCLLYYLQIFSLFCVLSFIHNVFTIPNFFIFLF